MGCKYAPLLDCRWRPFQSPFVNEKSKLAERNRTDTTAYHCFLRLRLEQSLLAAYANGGGRDLHGVREVQRERRRGRESAHKWALGWRSVCHQKKLSFTNSCSLTWSSFISLKAQFSLDFSLGTEPLQLTLTSPMSPTCNCRKPWYFCTALIEVPAQLWAEKPYRYLKGEQNPKPESNQKLAPFWTDKNFHFTRCLEGYVPYPSYLMVPEPKLHPCSSEHTTGWKTLPTPTNKPQGKKIPHLYRRHLPVYFKGLLRIFHIALVM